jgi:His-Xaa-Ser system protein HxsD
MKGVFTQLKDGKILVTLSKDIYEKDAVMAAAYKFMDNHAILIEPVSETEVGVIIEAKDKNQIENLEQAAKRFCNEVLDQQIRLDLEKRYGRIREMIVQHAFSPIKDLRNQLDQS